MVRILCGLVLAGWVCAHAAVFPLREVRAGMKGVGKTVFAGSRVEEFQVEVLGVLENIGPKQSLILARLSGGPLEKTGVMAGMSGSPVYLDGRLAGAVAMAFSFSKEPIAAVRPIEEMLAVDVPLPQIRRAGLWNGDLGKLLPPRQEVSAGQARLVDVATPISFGGFTRATLDHFSPQLRALGLEPSQGVSSGGSPDSAAAPGSIEPGSMITVQLLTGDLSVGADGTVTHVDGDRIYAFGHKFLSVGRTELPFAQAEVLALLPSISSSFKISAARRWAGVITEDRTTAVAGQIGRAAAMIPVAVNLVRRGADGAPVKRLSYQMGMVRDSILSPFLLQMAVFNAVDATEQTIGESTYTVSGQMEFEGASAPLKLDNAFAGDFNLPAQVSLSAATSVAYVLQAGFDQLRPKRVNLQIDAYPRKRQLRIDQVWASRRQVRPGETFEVAVLLTGENGQEVTRTVSYSVPPGARPGPLQITAADAGTINLTEYRQMLLQAPRSASQLISMMNSLRPNTGAYVRLWRTEPAYDVQGDTLPDPPPSLAMILGRSQGSLSPMPAVPNSKIAEFAIPTGETVVSGSKTIQVEIKE